MNIFDHDPREDAIDTRTPYDELVDSEEPNLNRNEYREASLRFIQIMNLSLSFILEGEDPRLRTLGVIYALGLDDLVGGKSMRELGRELGYSSGTISLNVKRFKQFANLKDI